MNQYFEPLGIYAHGYLDSACALFDRADKGRGLVDYAFYPAANCLRHGLELFIKQVSVYAAYELREPDLLYPHTHSLNQAWQPVSEHVRALAEEQIYSPTSEPSTDWHHQVDVIESVVEDLDELDPRGNLLRYPERLEKSGEHRRLVHQPPPFDAVNLSDWAATSTATAEAVLTLLNLMSERVSHIAHRRGDPPIRFHETTRGQKPSTE